MNNHSMPALKGGHDAIEIIKVEKHTKVTDSLASKYLCCQHILSDIGLAMFKVTTELYCGEGWKDPRLHPQLVHALGRADQSGNGLLRAR